MHRPSSMRRALGFVKRFIQSVLLPEGGPSVVPAPVLLETLRAQTLSSVVAAYLRFRRQQGRVTLPVLRQQINTLSVLFHNILGVLKQPLSLVCLGIPSAGPRRRKRHRDPPGTALTGPRARPWARRPCGGRWTTTRPRMPWISCAPTIPATTTGSTRSRRTRSAGCTWRARP